MLHMAGHDYAGVHSLAHGQGVPGVPMVGEALSKQGTSNSHVSSRGEDFLSDLDTSNPHMSSIEGGEETSDF